MAIFMQALDSQSGLQDAWLLNVMTGIYYNSVDGAGKGEFLTLGASSSNASRISLTVAGGVPDSTR